MKLITTETANLALRLFGQSLILAKVSYQQKKRAQQNKDEENPKSIFTLSQPT